MWEDDDDSIDLEKEMDYLEEMNEDLHDNLEQEDEPEEDNKIKSIFDNARTTKLTQKYFDQQLNIKLESSRDIIVFIYHEEKIACRILKKLTSGVYIVLQLFDDNTIPSKMKKINFKEIEII